MKKFFIVVTGLALILTSKAQPFIRASLQKSATPHSVDLLLTPTYASDAGEYVNIIQVNVSIPAAVATNVTAYITPINTFATGGVAFTAIPPYTESTTNEKVFGWIYQTAASNGPMAWTATEFIAARITFNGNPSASSFVKMLDLSLTGIGGGDLGYTFFGISTNAPPNDKTDYGAMFYTKPGESTVGTYLSGDQFVITDQTVTLPIELLSFSGYKDGTVNQLRWSTSTEQNNKGFEVQRSPDAVNYNPVGFVNSLAMGGNSSVQLNYTFTDDNVTGLKQFYRLRQVDIGGNSKISKIVLIKADNPAVVTIDGMFPNPATTNINMLVSAPAKDKLALIITDLSGKTVGQQSLNVETGSNILPVNISALAGGTYIVKMVSSNGDVATARFVKK